MSLYKKGWLFTAWMVLVLVAMPYWMPLLDSVFGSIGFALGLVLWLGHGVIALLFFACPECGLSAFLGSKSLLSSYAPWPRSKCGHCGHDHTLSRPSESS